MTPFPQKIFININMLEEAWNEGKQGKQGKERKQGKPPIKFKDIRGSLDEFLTAYSQRYLESHNKESIQKIVTNMGKKNDPVYNIKKYRCFNDQDLPTNLKPELMKLVPDSEISSFQEIWSELSNPVIIKLDELSGDEDYRNLSIQMRKGKNMVTGSNDSMLILDLLGVTSKWVDAICINLVYYKPSDCFIL